MISIVKTQKLFEAFCRAPGLLNFVLWPHFKAVFRIIGEPVSVVEECFRKSSQISFQQYITCSFMINLGAPSKSTPKIGSQNWFLEIP